MTIRFYCPNCDALIAFDSKHTGKRARCLSCGQIFIIPAKDDEKPKKIKPEPERTEPLGGFYHALFVDSWKIFFDPENLTSLAFVIAIVSFKFFLAAETCCMNYVSFVVVWGWLLQFYLNVIYEAGFEMDKLPKIYLGTIFTFLWYIIKPFLIFFFTMLMVQLPFLIALALLQDKGLTYQNMWDGRTGLHLLLQVLFISGLFLFPMAILTTAIGKDITLLRPDYILKPVLKAFIPYIVVVGWLVAFGVLETQTRQFSVLGEETVSSAAGKLTFNLTVQTVAIIAMRSIGLFYRHYNCHLKW